MKVKVSTNVTDKSNSQKAGREWGGDTVNKEHRLVQVFTRFTDAL